MTTHLLTLPILINRLYKDSADADAMKSGNKPHHDRLSGKTVAIVFEKPSTRTKVSFEVGIRRLGATPLNLRSEEMQLGHGESISDATKVLSGYVDAIMIRTAMTISSPSLRKMLLYLLSMG